MSRYRFGVMAVALAFALVLGTAGSASGGVGISVSINRDSNRIEGIVWDPYRKPVADIYVELMNSMEGDLARSRTTGAGRFTFFGLSTGRFRLKVVTSGTNFLEESQDVEILGTGIANSRDTQYVEFYLKLDPRKISLGSGGPPESVFVQDVPDDAKKLFKKGIQNIKTDAGLQLVESAIQAYPEYFDALAAAGKALVDRGQYVKGAGYLIRAIKINDRSYSCYGSIAFAAYKLNKIPEGIKAAEIAVSLESRAVSSRLLLARLYRSDKNYKQAEQVLLETKKIAPDIPMVYYELALVYNREGKNAEAAAELATYLKLSPNDSEKKDVEELIGKLKATPLAPGQ
jgi:tetratricopeptide (TPR) repeat protein